jgi:ABC-type enterochelin transport system substrate-binding protein
MSSQKLFRWSLLLCTTAALAGVPLLLTACEAKDESKSKSTTTKTTETPEGTKKTTETTEKKTETQQKP